MDFELVLILLLLISPLIICVFIYLRNRGETIKTGTKIVWNKVLSVLDFLFFLVTDPFVSLYLRFKKDKLEIRIKDILNDLEKVPTNGPQTRPSLKLTREKIVTVTRRFKTPNKADNDQYSEFGLARIKREPDLLKPLLSFSELDAHIQRLWEQGKYEQALARISQTVASLGYGWTRYEKFPQMLSNVVSLCKKLRIGLDGSRQDLLNVLDEMAANYEAGRLVNTWPQGQVTNHATKHSRDSKIAELGARTSGTVGTDSRDLVTNKSQETEWSGASKGIAPETVFAQTAVDLKAFEAAVEEQWEEGDVILDVYEVKEVLGEGGFGKVYRVHHRDWNIDLAVKTPRIDRLDEAGKENFRNEAETWVNLGLHPNTVSCYYVRDLGGIPRVFAEFVEGGSLSEWIHSGKLYEGGKEEALRRILDVAIQFAWGLHYAHEKGLVHQDVKPANVIMTPEGVAKVTDFGLAKARGIAGAEEGTPGASFLVASGGMTKEYASPEQAAGRPLSRKSDIWSWAVSVLEIFNGEVTWELGYLAADVLEGFVSPASDNHSIPSMPTSVRNLLSECFKSTPSERPKDMIAVATQMENVYQEITKNKFARQLVAPERVILGTLNNRAVSLLDLGNEAEAINVWDEVLTMEPFHPEATYNRGLVLWRAARIGEDVLVAEMEKVRNTHGRNWTSSYLTGLVHLERGDSAAALEALESIQGIDADKPEVRAAFTAACEEVSYSKKLNGNDAGRFAFSFSADSKYALSASSDKTLRLWELATGQCLRTFEGHTQAICSVALSADGNYSLSGGDDNTVRLWEVATGNFRLLSVVTRAFSLTFDTDGSFARAVSRSEATGGRGQGTILTWEVKTGKLLRKDTVDSWRILSADGKYALSDGDDKTQNVWEVATTKHTLTFENNGNRIESFSVSGDGECAFTGSQDGTLKLWEVATGRCLRTLEGHPTAVDSVSLSGDSRYAVSASRDGVVKLWEVNAGRCLRTFQGRGTTECSVSLSPDGRYFISRGEGETEYEEDIKNWRDLFAPDVGALLKMYSAGPDDRLRELPPQYLAPISMSRIVATEVATKTEEEYGQTIALAKEALANADVVTAKEHINRARSLIGCNRIPEAVELWGELYSHLPRKALKGGWEERSFKGHTAPVSSISFSSDSRYALSGSDDWTLKLWDIATGKCLRTFEGHKGPVLAVSFRPDNTCVLSGSQDKTMKLWHVATGTCLRTFQARNGAVMSVGFSADGVYAYSGDVEKGLMLWEVDTGRWLRRLESRGILSGCLSSHALTALSGSVDGSLTSWDVVSFRSRSFRPNRDQAVSVSLSANGTYGLAGGRGSDNALTFWTIETNRFRTFQGHADGVNSVCFSSDEKYALSGSADRTLKVWEISTGRCMRTLEGHAGGVNSISISPDGRYALSGSSDKTLKLWTLDWELEERQPVDWDKGAEAYLRTFLQERTPYAGSLPQDRDAFEEEVTMALTRRGKPTWSDSDFQRLLHTLSCAGYGWLRPAGVRRELEKMAVASPDATRLKRLVAAGIILSVAGLGAMGILIKSRFSNQQSKTSIDAAWRLRLKIPAHEQTSFLAFSPDGKSIVTGGSDQGTAGSYTVRIWDSSTGSLKKEMPGPNELADSQVTVTSNIIVIVSNAGLQILDAGTGALTLHEPRSSYIRSWDVSPDEKLVAMGLGDGLCELVDLQTGTTKAVLNHSGRKPGDNWSPISIQWVAFTPDGKMLATALAEVSGVKLWDKQTGNLLGELDTLGPIFFVKNSNAIVTTSRTNYIYDSTSTYNKSQLWDVNSRQLLREVDSDEVDSLTSDVQLRIDLTDEPIAVHRIENGRFVKDVSINTKRATGGAVSPVGNALVLLRSDLKTFKWWIELWEKNPQ